MIYPLPPEKAQEHCRKLIGALDTYRRIDFESPAPDPRLSTDCLFDSGLGQMFGVCVCLDAGGGEVVLKAFSGQFNSVWHVDGWVPPLLDTAVFDRSTADSDRRIHELTDRITALSNDHSEDAVQALAALKKERKRLSRKSMEEIFSLYKIHCVQQHCSFWTAAQSFSGENDSASLQYPSDQNDSAAAVPEPDPAYRKSSYRFADIFGAKMPPTGTGECCAPKLLDYAAVQGLRPVSLAEFYYGASNPSGTRIHKQFYPPCDDKCAPLLPYLLGLDIVYRDESIVVVDKPSGLLSVPGRGAHKQDCVVSRLKYLFPGCMEQPSVHRLDMDTSGLLVLALKPGAHRNLSAQFMNGTVRKKYHAVLSAPVRCPDAAVAPAAETAPDMEKNSGAAPVPSAKPACGVCLVTATGAQGNPVAGHIELPFRLDPDRRPYQIFDPVHGKTGITDWRICGTWKDGALPVVEFVPHTGRTHQLRLHAASSRGLGAPIYGDNLYGTACPGGRLMLHAWYLSFVHPENGKKMTFERPSGWIAVTAEKS